MNLDEYVDAPAKKDTVHSVTLRRVLLQDPSGNQKEIEKPASLITPDEAGVTIHRTTTSPSDWTWYPMHAVLLISCRFIDIRDGDGYMDSEGIEYVWERGPFGGFKEQT